MFDHVWFFSLSHSSRSFLLSRDGNPNKRNMHNETSLHLLCMGPQILTSEGALQPRISRPYEDQQRRAECLQLILAWTGAKLDQGEYERADINATDNKKNTCLHYAAASGMKTCVEVRFKKCLNFSPQRELWKCHRLKLYRLKMQCLTRTGSILVERKIKGGQSNPSAHKNVPICTSNFCTMAAGACSCFTSRCNPLLGTVICIKHISCVKFDDKTPLWTLQNTYVVD